MADPMDPHLLDPSHHWQTPSKRPLQHEHLCDRGTAFYIQIEFK
jgi:hypothetical protein